nr:hypothetical protein HAGR004_42020 [Bdellovibrio sp. HAGR004]BFD69186.1 hypothetical protein HAGR004_42080 [Bdellovibrio sp. HAGR004]
MKEEYYKSMRTNTKSSITLPPLELELVNELMKALNAKTKVEVIRRGLTLLKETTDRKALRSSFKEASEATRESLKKEIKELDSLSGEGLE